MEDVLEVYQRPRDADFPLVCLDESSKQLLADTREPIPMERGVPPAPTTSINVTERPICSWCSHLWKDDGMSR